MPSAPATRPSAPVGDLSFEDALQELEAIVRQLESGDVPLERSIALYERGAALKTHCEATLKSAQLKVEKIVLDPAGAPRAAPMEAE